jgi:hypothetical protein
MRLHLSTFLALSLLSCASINAVQVPNTKLGEYWIQKPSRPLEMITYHGPVTACVVVEFTINSSGKPRHVKAVATSYEEGPFVEVAVAQVRSQRFSPSPKNTNKIAITTRKVISWEWDSPNGNNDKIFAKCAL